MFDLRTININTAFAVWFGSRFAEIVGTDYTLAPIDPQFRKWWQPCCFPSLTRQWEPRRPTNAKFIHAVPQARRHYVSQNSSYTNKWFANKLKWACFPPAVFSLSPVAHFGSELFQHVLEILISTSLPLFDIRIWFKRSDVYMRTLSWVSCFIQPVIFIPATKDFIGSN